MCPQVFTLNSFCVVVNMKFKLILFILLFSTTDVQYLFSPFLYGVRVCFHIDQLIKVILQFCIGSSRNPSSSNIRLKSSSFYTRSQLYIRRGNAYSWYQV